MLLIDTLVDVSDLTDFFLAIISTFGFLATFFYSFLEYPLSAVVSCLPLVFDMDLVNMWIPK